MPKSKDQMVWVKFKCERQRKAQAKSVAALQGIHFFELMAKAMDFYIKAYYRGEKGV